jgi:hypothetical protein
MMSVGVITLLMTLGTSNMSYAAKAAKTSAKSTKGTSTVKSTGSSKQPKVVYEKETTIRFEDSLIEGKIIKPDGFFLLRKRPKKWQDLIKVRENFREELSQMKYDL